MSKDDNGFIILILLISLGVVISAFVVYTHSYVDHNKSMCMQLYSKTKDYESCKTKPIDENFKLIRSIDNE